MVNVYFTYNSGKHINYMFMISTWLFFLKINRKLKQLNFFFTNCLHVKNAMLHVIKKTIKNEIFQKKIFIKKRKDK